MILLSSLPLITFILLWLFFLAKAPDGQSEALSPRSALIFTGLFWSAYLALGTELLSLLEGLTTLGSSGLWVLAILVLGEFHWRGKSMKKGWQRLISAIKKWQPTLLECFILIACVIVLLILLITGLLSPPNIHDVLAYHMSRVMHWMQGDSLAFFPTPNSWQLWMPPFSEFSQLHWYLLAGNDLLSFFHQWYSLVLTMVVVSSIAKTLGAKPRGQWLAAFFVLTLPIILLQASGGKNDIVLVFFFSSLVYFVVQSSFRVLDWLERAACCLSAVLGILTKGTFPFFALIFLIWLLVNVLKRSGWKQTLMFIGMGILAILLVNGGHWLRNTLAFGSPFYTGSEEALVNARFGIRVTLSNLTRNAVAQINGEIGLINEGAQTVLKEIHSWLRMPLFDPEITQGPGEFYYVPNREEVAGNPFHFLLAGLGFLVLLARLAQKQERESWSRILVLSLSGLGSVILFSAVFRWQSWGTRFFIPFYAAFAPVIGIVYSKKFPSLITWLVVIALGVVMINPLLNNYSRSFSWAAENRNSIWRLSRKGLLFANNQNIEGAVLGLTQAMADSGCRTYGLRMRRNAPEYVLWGALQGDPNAYTLEHIHVENESADFASPHFDPCGIIFFEMIELYDLDETAYQLAARWKIGETYPFALYLKPEYIVGELE